MHEFCRRAIDGWLDSGRHYEMLNSKLCVAQIPASTLFSLRKNSGFWPNIVEVQSGELAQMFYRACRRYLRGQEVMRRYVEACWLCELADVYQETDVTPEE